jgi:hypothetical protein
VIGDAVRRPARVKRLRGVSGAGRQASSARVEVRSTVPSIAMRPGRWWPSTPWNASSRRNAARLLIERS